MKYRQSYGNVVLVVIFVELIELAVMHGTMSNVKEKFSYIEKKEELPDHGPDTRTSLGGHENFETEESVSINESTSKENVEDGAPDASIPELVPLLRILFPRPFEILYKL